MTKRLPLLLPASTRDKLNDLVPGRGKTLFLERIINEYDGTPIAEDTATNSTLNIADRTLENLDKIQVQNGIRSRNMAVKLLIDLAWERLQAQKQARLKL